MRVRPAKPQDLEVCGALEHSYTTDRVWQMETREENNLMTIAFRMVRLPREVRVAYPYQGKDLLAGWWRRDVFLVAEEDEHIYGYVALTAQPEHKLAWMGDLVVDRPHRRHGIGTALVRAAAQWGREHGLARIVLAVQTKNYPAIRFCRSRGLTFSGYSDRYWPSQDIALFFSGTLR
jgi:GNAT superfamily N-acetyltransferase